MKNLCPLCKQPLMSTDVCKTCVQHGSDHESGVNNIPFDTQRAGSEINHNSLSQNVSSQRGPHVQPQDVATVEDVSNRWQSEPLTEGESPLFPTNNMVDETVARSLPLRNMESQGHASMHLLETERVSTGLGHTEAPFDRVTKRPPGVRVVSEGVFTKTLSHEVYGNTKGDVSLAVSNTEASLSSDNEDTPSLPDLSDGENLEKSIDSDDWEASQTLNDESHAEDIEENEKGLELNQRPIRNKHVLVYGALIFVIVALLIWIFAS